MFTGKLLLLTKHKLLEKTTIKRRNQYNFRKNITIKKTMESLRLAQKESKHVLSSHRYMKNSGTTALGPKHWWLRYRFQPILIIILAIIISRNTAMTGGRIKRVQYIDFFFCIYHTQWLGQEPTCDSKDAISVLRWWGFVFQIVFLCLGKLGVIMLCVRFKSWMQSIRINARKYCVYGNA